MLKASALSIDPSESADDAVSADSVGDAAWNAGDVSSKPGNASSNVGNVAPSKSVCHAGSFPYHAVTSRLNAMSVHSISNYRNTCRLVRVASTLGRFVVSRQYR
jgi:hypothetical protein